jgi:hypothetical protein
MEIGLFGLSPDFIVALKQNRFALDLLKNAHGARVLAEGFL